MIIVIMIMIIITLWWSQVGWGPSYDGVTVKNNFVEIKGKRSFDARCDIHNDDDDDDSDDDDDHDDDHDHDHDHDHDEDDDDDDDDEDDDDDDHDATDFHKMSLVHLMRPGWDWCATILVQ